MNFYYAARSSARLEDVCEALARAFRLPPFQFDAHDTWRYAWSDGGHLRLNVTRASDSRIIETWRPTCPRGVNYQIILTAVDEPPGVASELSANLGSDVVQYAATPSSHDYTVEG